MAEKRRNKPNGYMDGNTARLIHAVPDYPGKKEQNPRKRREQERRRKEEIRRQNRALRNRERAYNISFSMFVSMAAAVAVVFFVSLQYLGSQSQIKSLEKQIASLQSELVTMKEENNSTLERLTATIDFEHIYDVAVNEYGMVHENSEKVHKFEGKESDYVIKYEDIPELKKDNWFSNILD